MNIRDICDSELEGDLLPALADFLGEHSLAYLDRAGLRRLSVIQRRMSDSDYFNTPESAHDLAWLKAAIETEL